MISPSGKVYPMCGPMSEWISPDPISTLWEFHPREMKHFVATVPLGHHSDPKFARALLDRFPFMIGNFACVHDDRDTMLSVVSNTGTALAYASRRLRRDDEVCLAAARNDADALYYSKMDHTRTDFACMAVRANPDTYAFFNNTVKEIALLAIRTQGLNLRHAAGYLRNDEEVVLAAVRSAPDALAFASERLRDLPAIVLAAVRRDGLAVRHAGRACRGRLNVAIAAVNQKRTAYGLLNWGLLANHRLSLWRPGKREVAFLLRRMPLTCDAQRLVLHFFSS